MGIQPNVLTTLAYKAETALGVPASGSGAKYLRRVSSGLAVNKDGFASNEARSDQQVASFRHGGRSARGSIEGELSADGYDDFFAALFRNEWQDGDVIDDGSFGSLTITNSGATSKLAFSSGSVFGSGLKIGDVVRGSGLTNAANNGINMRIVGMTDDDITVVPALTAQGSQASGWTITVAGSKLIKGSLAPSFTIEQAMAQAGVFEQFVGMRVGGASINVQPNGNTSVSWDMMGLNGDVKNAATFTNPEPESATPVVAGVDGSLRLAGKERAILTGLQMSITNNLSSSPVIGSRFVPEIFYGRFVVTGSVSAYIDSPELLEAFLNEEEVELHAQMDIPGPAPQDFLCFVMPRVKLNGAQKTIGPDGGVIAQMPFQALLPETGEDVDRSTMSLQRSY